MPLIKTGRVAADPFLQIADGEPLPAEGAIIVSLARWQEERGLIEPRHDPLGVRLKAADLVEQIAGDLDRLAVIALEFPKFNDGRALSQARLLRERYGYRGEIRATGKVVRDLLLFMHRCGFDAFATDDHVTAEVVRKSLATFSLSYQPAADGRPSVIELRHGRRAPAPEAVKEQGGVGSQDCCAGAG
ncbi:MAG TPA: DUF934 domain-containing protein [Dongiaceae bacterium]|jgi:uncharacterized protein (DUF934 family)|nr:DUF934 domain-containing protein [Dongiaceae bacterium]